MEGDGQTQSQPTSASSASCFRHWIQLRYLKSPEGILKSAECIMSFLALVIMSSISSIGIGSGRSAINFFIFLFTVIWLVVTVHIVLQLLDCWRRLPQVIFGNNLVFLVSCALASLLTLIASAVVMDKFDYYDRVTAAGAFGMICFLLLLFESIMYLVKFRREGAIPLTTTNTASTVDEFHNPGEPQY